MFLHLSRPFAGSYEITQPFGPTTFAAEPPGFIWSDGTLSYYQDAPGAVRYPNAHSGIDYAVPNGTPLLAPAGGTVVMASLDSTGYGLCLKVDHGPVTSLMGHLTAIHVPLGAKVRVGQIVAHSGGDPANEPNSGNSSGPHLHFSTIDTTLSPARYRNPADYILATPSPTHTPTDGDPITWVSFAVTAMNDHEPVRAFDGPSIRCNPLADIPGGTAINCNGWMLGQGRPDATRGNAIDHRWYHCPFGLISSSRVLGNAPGSNP